MASFRSLYAILTICFSFTWAQQLDGTQMYIGSPGLSESCTTALNTNVSCPSALAILSTRNTVLDTDQVEALCVDTCHSSLESARSAIKGACTAGTDVILYDDAEYPATYVVDNFLFTYDISCRKDSKTGAFCDPQFLAWSTQINLTSAQKYCSECWLGVQALQLSEPLGYDEGLASNLASLTSSCNATGYDFTSPTAFASPATAVSDTSVTSVESGTTAAPSSTCQGSYTVETADDCNAVAKAHNVSTYDLLRVNNLDLYCSNFESAVGKTLCIPLTCNTYTWQAQDSCDSLVKQFADITVTQFLSWNPIFNLLCQNSLNFVGYEVCVGPPGGYLPTKSTGNSSNSNPTVSAVPAPTNAANGSSKACGKWYTISEGDTCSIVSIANSIPVSDFYSLNLELDKDCTNLLLGFAYCVKSASTGGSADMIMTAPPSAASNDSQGARRKLFRQ